MTACPDLDVFQFSRALLTSDSDFAGRVESFESLYGPTSEDMLAVLAQAICLCPYNHQFTQNLRALCRAIETGRPTEFYYHFQITEERWLEMHSFVIGVQRWLGSDLSVPDGVDIEKVQQIAEWLGERSSAKEALCELFLIRLVDFLFNYISFAHLASQGSTAAEFPCFRDWYVRSDGRPLALQHGLTPDGGQDSFYFQNETTMAGDVEELKERVRNAMPSATQDTEELIEKVFKGSQPPCMQRFSRYLDIRLTSIGALKWRGSVPADRSKKAEMVRCKKEATDALSGWASDAPPCNQLAEQLYAILGEATEQRKSVARNFCRLLSPPKDPDIGWDWLSATTQTMGTTVACANCATKQGKA